MADPARLERAAFGHAGSSPALVIKEQRVKRALVDQR